MFFRVQVFQGPDPGSRVQGPGPGSRVRIQVLEVAVDSLTSKAAIYRDLLTLKCSLTQFKKLRSEKKC